MPVFVLREGERERERHIANKEWKWEAHCRQVLEVAGHVQGYEDAHPVREQSAS